MGSVRSRFRVVASVTQDDRDDFFDAFSDFVLAVVVAGAELLQRGRGAKAARHPERARVHPRAMRGSVRQRR
jgi:hypothetical protein